MPEIILAWEQKYSLTKGLLSKDKGSKCLAQIMILPVLTSTIVMKKIKI
jgi:hypothetical protein